MLCRHTFFLFTLTSTEQNCVVKPAEELEGGGGCHILEAAEICQGAKKNSTVGMISYSF
jgi:hypothetical protein